MKYFQLFRITADANKINYDDGLKSTAVEKKRLIACHVQTDKYAPTDDNEIQGYHERAKVFDIPEKLFPDELSSNTTSTLAGTRYMSVPVDLDIPVGESFKVAIKCASTKVNIRGAYEYEMIS